LVVFSPQANDAAVSSVFAGDALHDRLRVHERPPVSDVDQHRARRGQLMEAVWNWPYPILLVRPFSGVEACLDQIGCEPLQRSSI
jgi:hypothetical protein